MRRVSVSVVMLAALLGMYWPDVAWIALFNTASGAFARHIRQWWRGGRSCKYGI